jgi:trehalose 6-phosphate synthase/phosphatase
VNAPVTDGDESPVVVVSNRLPFTVSRGPRGLERHAASGGLVSALDPVLRARGGTWIGWPGLDLRVGEEIPQPSNYHVESVSLSDAEVQRYYQGFSNGTLWPLFHSLPAMAHFERLDWQVYERVNSRFAGTVVEMATEEDLIWIHDYHLMLVPEQVRQRKPSSRIAFFLHIPFPPYDLFRLCPWEIELLTGLLGCDLIGFHIEGYARNFMDCVELGLGARVDRKRMLVEYGNRTAKIGVFPIGISFKEFELAAYGETERPGPMKERMVLGVDRLDYTKGIPHRIRAFERLLELHPENRERVTLLQLAIPSRSQVAQYRTLKREIDELVGRVNGRFATANWSPIRYLYRSVSKERLSSLYRDASVALVTPLRDGMNLVAKEFVACQVDDPGVLVLSRLAGASVTMREALPVNPYNIDETAEAVHRALNMSEEERASRMTALRRRERRDDVGSWVTKFLAEAKSSVEPLHPVSDEELEAWLADFIRGYRLVLFLDYDGTLTPLVDHPDNALLSDAMRHALGCCIRRTDTEVAIVSGRALENIRELVKEPKLVYAGNHGLEIEGPGLEHFRHEDLIHYQDRALELAKRLSEIEAHGAWTEFKGTSLTFHVREVPEDERAGLLQQARQLMTDVGYQAREAHAALEARPPIGWDKGRAVLHILRERFGPSWSEGVRVIYVGDDQTDEDAFRFLAGLALTFRVGSSETITAARHLLPDPNAVRALLDWVGRRPTG